MDPFILVVASALAASIMASKMLLLYRAGLRQPCLLDWSLSGLYFLVSSAIGALAAKYQVSQTLAPAIANLFYVAGHAGILAGVRPLLEQELMVPMTVSVGLAAARATDLRWEDVLRHADEAMYHAKQRGRNCVAVYGVDVGPKEVARPHAMAA